MFVDIFYYIDDESLSELREVLARLFSSFHNFHVSFKRLYDIPNKFYDEIRKQYRADYVNTWLSRKGRGDVKIGILDIDGYVPGLNFVFGVAVPFLQTASVFLHRLKYNADTELYHRRIRKEVLHELGHLFGLDHCNNYRCVMSFSNSLRDVDKKEDKYCERDFNLLIRKGLKVDSSLLLT